MAKVIGLFDAQRKAPPAQRRGRRRRSTRDSDFPAALVAWTRTHADLIDSLGALRRLGEDGSEALEVLLAMRPVATVRASWELFEALAEGDGDDPELLLLKVLSPWQLESARRALWGPRWDTEVVAGAPAGSCRARVRSTRGRG